MSVASKISPLVIGVVLLGGFITYLNMPEEKTQGRRSAGATPVKVETVQRQMFPVTIEALGTARANESVTLTAQDTEIVSQVTFDDGQVVDKGQLLVQLNDREEQARVNELKVSLAEAKRQLTRIKDLAKENAASEQLLDEQQARVKTLEAQIEVANAQVRDLQIRAPFAGRLGIREISVGSLVRPADAITTLDDISAVKVDFSIAENHLASLNVGQKVTASSVAYPAEQFTGEISGIDSRIDPVTRSILVRAIINNREEKLRPGMLLQITLEKQVLETLVIPEKALVPNQDKQFVFVLVEDKVRQQEVIIGARRPGTVQVIDGLQEGDRVVTEGTLRIRDQSKVRVIEEIAKG